MSKKKESKKKEQEVENEVIDQQEANNPEETIEEEAAAEAIPVDELAEFKNKYLRLYSEFENYRKRTNKEKIDLMSSANKELLADLLPVIDDFERAIKSNEEVTDVDTIKEGFNLLHNKFDGIMTSKGVKAIEAQGEVFDTELHEAITQIPSPSEDMKGKVIDVVEKGYTLGDKVIRYAKVVIGA